MAGLSSMFPMLVLAALALSAPASKAQAAYDSPTQVTAAGAGLAGAWGATPGFHLSAELSVGWMTLTDKTLILSAGGILSLSGPRYAYGEVATWVPLAQIIGPTIGVGTGYRWLEAKSGPAAHLFIGVPIGLPIIDYGIMYAEPYYRPQFSFRFQERTHEVGMLMKVIFQHKKR
jgi:hypothetical protein